MTVYKQSEKPKIIEGGLSVDDRGCVTFVNQFDFKDIKRFYVVENHRANIVRAWHAHKKEVKYVFAVRGTAQVAAVAVDDWKKPSKNAKVFRYVLSAKMPQLLYIPKGFANGFMSLTPDTQLIFYSTSTLKESLNDDFRYDSRYWDIWNVEEK